MRMLIMMKEKPKRDNKERKKGRKKGKNNNIIT